MTETTPEVSGQQLEHNGRSGELVAITMGNQLLTLLTVGIYYFWGKTKVRRYLWSQTSFGGERFEYTGRGGELLRGFLLAMLILAPLGGLFYYLQFTMGENSVVGSVASPALYAWFFFLTGVATFSARRYMLSRTRLRGIRFGLSGSAKIHGLKTLGYTLLSMISFGVYTPFMRSHLMGHLMENTWFGNLKATYSGNGKGLFRKFLLAWAMAVVVVGVGIGGMGASIFLANSQGESPGLAGAIAPLLILLLLLPTLGLITVWYKGAELRYFVENTSLGSLKFRAGYSGWQFMGFGVVNLVLLVVTLGLGMPFVLVRSARFMAGHIQVSGALDFTAIAQSTQEIPGGGEGLAEAFDLGAV